MIQMNEFTKQFLRHRKKKKKKLWLPKEKEEGGINWGFRIHRCTLLQTKWRNSKGLLCGAGDCCFL